MAAGLRNATWTGPTWSQLIRLACRRPRVAPFNLSDSAPCRHPSKPLHAAERAWSSNSCSWARGNRNHVGRPTHARYRYREISCGKTLQRHTLNRHRYLSQPAIFQSGALLLRTPPHLQIPTPVNKLLFKDRFAARRNREQCSVVPLAMCI